MPQRLEILNQTDVRKLIAEHYKVDVADVIVKINKGFDGGQLDYEPPSFEVTVDISKQRL